MKLSSRQIIAYFGIYLMLGAIIASLGPTLPDMAANLGAGIAAISILFTTRSLGYLAGSLLGGYLYDRFHGHRVLFILLTVGAISLGFVPGLGSIVLLGSIFLLIGITQGGMDVGANTLLVRASKANVGAYLNTMFFFAGVGSFLIPLYLGSVSLTWGYRGLSLAIVPIALWVLFTPAPQIPQRIKADHIRLTNTPLFIAFACLAFIFIGAEASYGGWLFTYVASSGLGSQSAAYTLTSVFWFSVMLGRLLAIPIAARFKLERIIIGYLAGAFLSAGVLFFLRNHAIAVWIGSVAMGLSIAALFPSTYTFVQGKMRLSGKLTGVVWAGGSLGAMTLPWLIGQRIELVGPASMMAIMFIVWSLALGIFLAALRTLSPAGSR